MWPALPALACVWYYVTCLETPLQDTSPRVVFTHVPGAQQFTMARVGSAAQRSGRHRNACTPQALPLQVARADESTCAASPCALYTPLPRHGHVIAPSTHPHHRAPH